MILHRRFADTTLASMAKPHPNYAGDFTSSFATVFESHDGLLHIGFEQLTGELEAAALDEFAEVILLVLEGSAEIESRGQTFSVGAGDVLVQHHPIEAKRITTSGLKTLFVIRKRTSTARSPAHTSVNRGE